MEHEFPGAVPEIPVSDIDMAAAYYKNQLGFSIDRVVRTAGSQEFRKGTAECS